MTAKKNLLLSKPKLELLKSSIKSSSSFSIKLSEKKRRKINLNFFPLKKLVNLNEIFMTWILIRIKIK